MILTSTDFRKAAILFSARVHAEGKRPIQIDDFDKWLSKGAEREGFRFTAQAMHSVKGDALINVKFEGGRP